MRWVPGPRTIPRPRLSRGLSVLGTLLVLMVGIALLAVAPARAAYGGEGTESYSWTNGPVLCVFNASLPSVVVSASALNDTGIGAGLSQIDELNATTGSVVATATMGSAAWEGANNSTARWFVMSYAEWVTVSSGGPPVHAVGSAWVSIQFVLSRPPTTAPEADEVAFQLTVQDWPWQAVGDRLALEIQTWSAYPTIEHMTVSSPTSQQVESVRTSTGEPLEYFLANSSAITETGLSIPVTPQTAIADGVATTTLTLGSGAAGSSALEYQASLGILLSTHVLGLPLYDYAAVGAGAGLVALVVGVGTRRVRRRPSDLTYVEESG